MGQEILGRVIIALGTGLVIVFVLRLVNNL